MKDPWNYILDSDNKDPKYIYRHHPVYRDQKAELVWKDEELSEDNFKSRYLKESYEDLSKEN